MLRSRAGCASVALVLALAASACGSKKEGPTTTVPGTGVALILPGKVDVAGLALASSYELPAPLKRYQTAITDHFVHVKSFDVTPHDRKLDGVGRLMVALEPKELPPGRSLTELVAVTQVSDAKLEDLPVKVVGGKLQIEIRTLSPVIVLVPLAGIELLGTPALTVAGSSEILLGDCAAWVTPDSPGIAALAPKLAVQDGTISLPTKLEAKRGDATTRMLHADEVLERGGGDSVNTSVLLASLLRARGYAVQLVAGHATYQPAGKDGKPRRGFHQWVEVMIDGKPFYVDALDPGTVWLRPLAEAQQSFALATRRTCAAYPPGHPQDRAQWEVPAAAGTGSGSAAPTSGSGSAAPASGSASGSGSAAAANGSASGSESAVPASGSGSAPARP